MFNLIKKSSTKFKHKLFGKCFIRDCLNNDYAIIKLIWKEKSLKVD